MREEHCRIAGCPGEYEQRRRLHATSHNGQPVVIDGVPMLVCDFCGDTLLSWETVRCLEELREPPPQPARMIPLYQFAGDAEQQRDEATVGASSLPAAPAP